MLRGMTAYAKAAKKFNEVDVVVEVHSVNRKLLDVTIRLPVEYSCFEPGLRKLLSEYALRGHLTCTVQMHGMGDASLLVEGNTAYAQSLFSAAEALAKQLGVPSVDYAAIFPFILKEKGVFQIRSNPAAIQELQNHLIETLQEACQAFIKIKEQEGLAIFAEITQRLQKIETSRLEIETFAEGSSEKYKQRLSRLLSDLGCDIQNDERLVKECAIVAEKLDISEELARLCFHIQHMKEAMKVPGCGKTLEFILQEMQREANTIASKSQSAEISKLVIMTKSEIEKIREQVQNVE